MDARIASRRHDRLPRERRGGADRERRSARRGVPSRREAARALDDRHGVREARRRSTHRSGGAVLGPARHRDPAAGTCPTASGGSRRRRTGGRSRLRRGKASITLEPGGQVELSGEPYRTLHETREELATHVHELATIGGELDIAFVGLGIHPMSTLDEIEWVPKQRYAIMRAYMTRVGTLGHRMMKQTATVQANIDYADERRRHAQASYRDGDGATGECHLRQLLHLGEPAERPDELPRLHLDRHRSGALRAAAVRVPHRRVVSRLRRVGARRPALLRAARRALPDRGHRRAVPAVPRHGSRRPARHARRLAPPPDHAVPRGSPEGLHRAPVRRQPAARHASSGCRRW